MSNVKTQFYYNEPYIIDQQSKFFRCGQRIRKIREDLELSPARFISWCDIERESMLEKIEMENEEVSIETLRSISNNFGVKLEWLCYEEEIKYNNIKIIHIFQEQFIDEILDQKPTKSFIILNEESLELALCIHIKACLYERYSFSFNLAFGDWIDDHSKIWGVYKLLEKINTTLNPTALILTNENYRKLMDCNVHPRSLIIQTSPCNWFSDLLELDIASSLSIIRDIKKEFKKYKPANI